MLKLCCCMNATENVRGINFKLTYLTPEQVLSTQPTSIYAITIEFDNRYNLLHYISTDTSPPPYSPFSTLQLPSNVYYPNQNTLK
ncbi:hypothetical protein RO3G_12636 [Rhizopus delemar RA 99-880]|uniref:Uncharacterized protein n=3 Tax=Rhizopus TaxID=4842 RepID=I1CHJ5_RHIO9|nr:hypothetical protein RO3G_12636 [Rhizopus delemar RA 99-880]|eukprot:EIE87925.1 hypothetical protein RO3G_12636 [Rhizopus delemar RA 99-880]